MATIQTDSAFVNATAMVAGKWNTKYNLLYNELNGNIDNYNIATTSGVPENKIQFQDGGHDHSGGKAITLNAISTAGMNKGEFVYYTGTSWAAFGTGANATTLQYKIDSDIKLLCNFDGANTATTFVAATGQTATFVGTAQLSTSLPKYGTASLLLDGNSDYVKFLNSADWDFGTGAFTIDFWVKFSALGKQQVLFGTYYNGDGYYLTMTSSDKLNFDCWTSNSKTLSFSQTSSGGWVTGTWYHVALVRNSNTFTIYRNGVSIATTTDADAVNDSGNQVLAIGALDNGGAPEQYVNGNIDEFRISKGLARWTANFTPPNTEYIAVLQWA